MPSTTTDVWLPPIGITRPFANSLLTKPASAASSTTYQNGRSPLDDELLNVSRSGCVLRTSEPLIGVAGVGTESDTPAIGPATFGLSGLRLFSASQAASASAATAT